MPPEPRPLTPPEDALLTAFLEFDFPGVEELRIQARSVRVTGTCRCGCGTVDLQPVGDVPPSPAISPVGVACDILDTDGSTAGGVMLLLRNGLLALLEVYGYTGSPLPLPALDTVELRLAD